MYSDLFLTGSRKIDVRRQLQVGLALVRFGGTSSLSKYIGGTSLVDQSTTNSTWKIFLFFNKICNYGMLVSYYNLVHTILWNIHHCGLCRCKFANLATSKRASTFFPLRHFYNSRRPFLINRLFYCNEVYSHCVAPD